MLFSEFTSEPALFARSPRELEEIGFKTSDPERIEQVGRRLSRDYEFVNGLHARARNREFQSEIELARAIAMSFSVKRTRSRCGEFCGIDEYFVEIPAGDGCCSDYAQLFIAIAGALGLDSRKAFSCMFGQCAHTTVEFYVDGRGWIWIDPFTALMAVNEDGGHISLIEMRKMVLSGRRPEFVFFGTPEHAFSSESPHDSVLYSGLDPFRDIGFRMGNNVFEEEEFMAGPARAPKPVTQFVGLVMGRIPGYVMLLDQHSSARMKRAQTGKFLYVAWLSLMVLFLVAYPAAGAVTLVSSARAARNRAAAMRDPEPPKL